ncbi:DUF1361 domain-containing protein [Paenibacillus filicis]|uniref:DUF1361 domain-containing protein n=1 Tax=Paenibacillus filicis TaxID=669464 RepID=A0ABU9DXA3_9BACL
MRSGKLKPYAIIAILLVFTVFCTGASMYLRFRTGTIVYQSWVWDIFLGWVPLTLSLILLEIAGRKRTLFSRFLLTAVGLAWFFFLPNASYLVTELIHVFRDFKPIPHTTFWLHTDFWLGLVVAFSTGLLGLMLFSLSLYIVHRIVSETLGEWYGWLGAGLVVGVSSIGIYIGRFIRWNSWDVISDPQAILRDLLEIVSDDRSRRFMLAFTLLILVVQTVMYLFFYAVAAMGSRQSFKSS